MKRILAIETSCDETAIAIVEAEGDESSARFRVLGNALLSQIEIHRQYGGVYPNLAKREHAKNLVPILEAALEEAGLLHEDTQAIPEETHNELARLLERESGLTEAFFEFLSECEVPEIDAIAVTAGPGLEPALWVGINFAKALALLWRKPLVAVNHMEGHIFAALASESKGQTFRKAVDTGDKSGQVLEIEGVELPVLALLISGGHTELVLMKDWLEYELIGQTRDDAVGETFDKVARMLALPYPGGPEISKLAEAIRVSGNPESPFDIKLPRPMIDSNTCDFSFAGLKTAVLYFLKKRPELSDAEKKHVAYAFEEAVGEVLWKKSAQALDETSAKTLVIGGGVSANTHIRRVFKKEVAQYADVTLRIPAAALTTDNAIMIAIAAFYHARKEEFVTDITASGTLALA